MHDFMSLVFFCAVSIGGLLLYFLPTIIAVKRKHRNDNSILITNFFFGWTGIGYAGCLAWAFSSNVKQ